MSPVFVNINTPTQTEYCMRVTYVAKKLNIEGGGSNFSLELLSRKLAERGHDVTILTAKPEKNKLPEDVPYSIKSGVDRRFRTRLGTQETYARMMAKYDKITDIFHVFTPTAITGAAWFCRRSESSPVVARLNEYRMFCVNQDQIDGQCYEHCTVTKKFLHDEDTLIRRIGKLPLQASRTYLEPHLAANIDAYFALSPAVREVYTAVGLPKERISVVPNFYDPDFTEDDSDADVSLPGNRLSVLYIGRIRRKKGIDTLLRALTELEGVHATIVGNGPYETELRTLATELGIKNQLTFVGWVDHTELPAYYESADVFIHPARWPEPFGRTLLESMQVGTPLVVSDIGGPPWVVGDAGRTFPAEDATALAETLRDLAESPDEVSRLASNCDLELTRFGPKQIVDMVEKKYMNLVSG